MIVGLRFHPQQWQTALLQRIMGIPESPVNDIVLHATHNCLLKREGSRRATRPRRPTGPRTVRFRHGSGAGGPHKGVREVREGEVRDKGAWVGLGQLSAVPLQKRNLKISSADPTTHASPEKQVAPAYTHREEGAAVSASPSSVPGDTALEITTN